MVCIHRQKVLEDRVGRGEVKFDADAREESDLGGFLREMRSNWERIGRGEVKFNADAREESDLGGFLREMGSV